jgi:hypothetical protein
MSNDNEQHDDDFDREAYTAIITAVNRLGWEIAVPHGEPDAIVRGLVIGERGYVAVMVQAPQLAALLDQLADARDSYIEGKIEQVDLALAASRVVEAAAALKAEREGGK